MIRIGTRGSKLALWQANFVASALGKRGLEAQIEIIRTTGDRMQGLPLPEVGTKGMFTLEIEQALLAGEIDLAVHSLKDLPTALASEFSLGAIPQREDARDALLAIEPVTFASLPHQARVGTSSLRRQAQLLNLRPDLRVESIRGNIDTRLRKLEAGEYDALVLAAAGVNRLEMTAHLHECLDPAILCPAPGQGALAIEIRSDDPKIRSGIAFLDDAKTRIAVTAERKLLAAMGGGCMVPIGAYCRAESGSYRILAVVASPDGRAILRAEKTGADPEHLALTLASELFANGAGEILNLHPQVG